MLIHEDRLFPADPAARAVARRLYDHVKALPIVSPHGHTDPRWYAENEPFPDPARLFVVPDHYIFRMLYSQGVPLQDLGIASRDGSAVATDPRAIWRLFAERYHLFRGTPTRLWLDHAFATLFGLERRLSAETADHYYDIIADALRQPEFRPRALFERFNIEVIATTESPLDELRWHAMIRQSRLAGPRHHRLPPRSGRRSRFPRISRQRRPPRRAHRRGHGHVGRLSRGAPQAAGLLPDRTAPPRPTTAIRRRARPTCRLRPPRPCSGASRAAILRPRMPSCSALRCSPRWPA